MRRPLMLLALLWVGPLMADEPAKKICLRPSDINNTVIVDDNTILFYMKGGKIWKNELEDRCYGLNIERAYAYEVHGD